MTGAAIYDATKLGPEVISMNMTSVMLVYSSLFARWVWVVQPRNVALAACHVSNVLAQTNQMRRALEHKIANGLEDEVKSFLIKAGTFAAGIGALICGTDHPSGSGQRKPGANICSERSSCWAVHRAFLGPHVQVVDQWGLFLGLGPSHRQGELVPIHGPDLDRVFL